ncbi:acetyl-CoA C-acetyltransferase [Agromyces indicus]|uniref:Probable acetyl-CoA acetyltransferase n=1 Tax=Agromyces indicus TaxID=758919 RepID=A0ABU1FP11_9MICO|nr:acetyl-CoA C-acetyltransferase [Agromyces indicus]MDR5693201.1 acetyl-CoA C-acetyltransferase [Agromyces indicus]
MSFPDVVIVAGARTPFGRIAGNLGTRTAVELGTVAIRGALEKAGVSPDDVDAVIMGQVLQAGAGQNPAKQSAVAAGIPWRVPAMTINKVCLSGLVAVTDAARMIRLGEADVVVAGGQESMTNAPHVLPGSRKGHLYGSIELLDTTAHDGLTDAFDHESMGSSTERYNERYGLGRAEQDEIAAASHVRAGRAQADGLFDDEIVPVEIPQRKGDPVIVTTDEGVRPDSTPETLARLRPAFAEGGAITAGNSSPISDGAAAVVVASRVWAEERGLPWLAVVGASGQVAGPDNSLHSQPSNAIAAALDRAGWSAADLDLVEINEAFAAVSLQSMKDLSLDHEKVNVHGGAIALGHPIGASGARLALHAALELARRGDGRAAVALCGGGGQGEALLLSR